MAANVSVSEISGFVRYLQGLKMNWLELVMLNSGLQQGVGVGLGFGFGIGLGIGSWGLWVGDDRSQ